jgi:hypothetical protein
MQWQKEKKKKTLSLPRIKQQLWCHFAERAILDHLGEVHRI